MASFCAGLCFSDSPSSRAKETLGLTYLEKACTRRANVVSFSTERPSNLAQLGVIGMIFGELQSINHLDAGPVSMLAQRSMGLL